MNKSIFRYWDYYFFKSNSPKHFKAYTTIIYLYTFLVLGNYDISLETPNSEFWHPVSFFCFWNQEIWTYLSRDSFIVLKISSVLSLYRVKFSISSKLCFVSAVLNLGYYNNFGKVSHSYHLIVITLGLLALIPFNPKREQLWPLSLIKIYAASIYFAAGISKLQTGGLKWVFSENFYRRLVIHPGKTKLSQAIIDLPPMVAVFLAFSIVFLIQLPAVLAPFKKRAGYYLFASAFFFHLGSILLFTGHSMYLSYVASLSVFLPLVFWSDQLKLALKALIQYLKIE